MGDDSWAARAWQEVLEVERIVAFWNARSGGKLNRDQRAVLEGIPTLNAWAAWRRQKLEEGALWRALALDDGSHSISHWGVFDAGT